MLSVQELNLIYTYLTHLTYGVYGIIDNKLSIEEINKVISLSRRCLEEIDEYEYSLNTLAHSSKSII
jgi:hypothetical protein